MSIAVLNQVYDESKRLAIAGSVVAAGDFRLKKLLPPLEQAGVKAPVFAKVAEAVKAVVEGPEKQASQALLDLTALVSAVLYTQGETGIEGKLEPIQTVNLGGSVVQTSARMLKPLLEALSSTGSGRVELVKEAIERGTFNDLRLVRPAIKAIEDPYPELADMICEKVLPLYGTAIMGELKAKYDPKGRAANARRLKLMHNLDPKGTRELVKAALEESTKEVKIAAIECLGTDAEDLNFLLEQAAAKSQEVRAAAYISLARLDAPEAIPVFEKGLLGKDLHNVSRAFQDSTNPKHADLVAKLIDNSLLELPKQKTKDKVSEAIEKIIGLIGAFPAKANKSEEALILKLFHQRADFIKYKGSNYSGTDLLETLVEHMSGNSYDGTGSAVLRKELINSQKDLPPNFFDHIVQAGRWVYTPAEFFDHFSPYFVHASPTKAKGKKHPDADKWAVILDAIDADYIHYYYYYHQRENQPKLDPRWLDVAVEHELLGLAFAMKVKNSPKLNAMLSAKFDKMAAPKSKETGNLDDVITVMVYCEHPQAVDYLLKAYERQAKAKYHYYYWTFRVITMLPKSAIPTLEAYIPNVKKEQLDQFVEAIEELRRKPEETK